MAPVMPRSSPPASFAMNANPIWATPARIRTIPMMKVVTTVASHRLPSASTPRMAIAAPTPLTSAQCSRSTSCPGCRPTSAMQTSSLPCPVARCQSWPEYTSETSVGTPNGPVAASGTGCYDPPPVVDPWCSGPTCQPVTLEIAGSNPVGSAINLVSSHAPSARPDGAFFLPRGGWIQLGMARACRLSPVTVRDPGYDPRTPNTPASRSMAHPLTPPPGPGPRRWLGPAIIAAALLLVLVVAVALGSGALSGTPAPSGAVAGVGSPTPAVSGAPSTPAGTDQPASPTPGDSPSPSSPPPAADAQLAFAPVVPFRSPRSATKRADVTGLATGGSPFGALVLVERDADGILDALGLDRAGLGKKLVTVPSAERLAANLANHPNRIGFLRADEVGPSVRAVAWGGKALFGTDRVKNLAAWPLTATLPASAADAPAYDPAAAWTLFAGGDILLDRGVSLAIGAHDADFPFDGGTAEITGLCKDCSPLGWDTPYTRRTGHAGAVRDLISGADLAIANFENPAPNRFSFHDQGTNFSANPANIKGLVDAGIDWVSLANNHAADQGTTGILQTMRNLDKAGIEHGGAGRTFAKAHEATLMQVGDVTVGILGYDAIRPAANADGDTPGTARITQANLKRDIKAARKAGADVVVVFPHWGIEYRAEPVQSQETMAHAAIDAGADMVIGNHPHWAEGMEVYKGKPIWYGLGNFVFDQTWSNYTMEGITLELTFRGSDLVQARMRPHIILDKAQANFLDPAGSGKFVMDQVFNASEGRLPW